MGADCAVAPVAAEPKPNALGAAGLVAEGVADVVPNENPPVVGAVDVPNAGVDPKENPPVDGGGTFAGALGGDCGAPEALESAD